MVIDWWTLRALLRLADMIAHPARLRGWNDPRWKSRSAGRVLVPWQPDGQAFSLRFCDPVRRGPSRRDSSESLRTFIPWADLPCARVSSFCEIGRASPIESPVTGQSSAFAAEQPRLATPPHPPGTTTAKRRNQPPLKDTAPEGSLSGNYRTCTDCRRPHPSRRFPVDYCQHSFVMMSVYSQRLSTRGVSSVAWRSEILQSPRSMTQPRPLHLFAMRFVSPLVM